MAYGRIDSENGGWVAHLKKYWDKLARFNSVFNLSISGTTSEMILERIEREAKVRKSHIIIINVGYNDAKIFNGKQKILTEDFKINIQKIIDISKKIAGKIIFIGLTQVDENKTTPLLIKNNNVVWTNQEQQKYNQVIQEICKKNNIEFVNLWDTLEKEDLVDGIHPNPGGHQKIFREIKKVLDYQEQDMKKLFEELKNKIKNNYE